MSNKSRLDCIRVNLESCPIFKNRYKINKKIKPFENLK